MFLHVIERTRRRFVAFAVIAFLLSGGAALAFNSARVGEAIVWCDGTNDDLDGDFVNDAACAAASCDKIVEADSRARGSCSRQALR